MDFKVDSWYTKKVTDGQNNKLAITVTNYRTLPDFLKLLRKFSKVGVGDYRNGSSPQELK